MLSGFDYRIFSPLLHSPKRTIHFSAGHLAIVVVELLQKADFFYQPLIMYCQIFQTLASLSAGFKARLHCHFDDLARLLACHELFPPPRSDSSAADSLAGHQMTDASPVYWPRRNNSRR